MLRGWSWPNVWLGASVVDQAEADRDIPKLLATPAAKRFVSYEPALGPVDFTRFFPGDLHWIIVGGESAQTTPGTRKAKARHFDVHWARETIRQCKAAGVACFVKQLGSNASTDHRTRPEGEAFYWTKLLRERAGADPAEWPVDLRVQEFPS
jgi:protein gp37